MSDCHTRVGLAGKLAFALLGIVAGGLAIQAVLDVHRVHSLHRREIRVNLEQFGTALARGAQKLWVHSGEEAAKRFLQSADSQQSHVRVQLLGAGEVGTADPSEVRFHLPLKVGGEVVGTVELRRSLIVHEEFLKGLLESKAVIASVLLLVCGAVIVAAGGWLVRRPLRRLTRQAEQIAVGKFSANLEVKRRDEIGALARAMNAMAEQLAATQSSLREERRARTASLERLRHADRLATVGKISSGIAHQLGTPLNVVTGRAALIASSDAPEQVQKDARAINSAAENMAQIIQQLLHFSRRRGLDTERARLRDVIDEAENLIGPIAELSGVRVAVTGPTSVEASIDVGKVLQVLTNLMMNGIQAMPDGGNLTLVVSTEHVEEPPEKRARPGDYVVVSIEDEGKGLALEELEHIFEPFFKPMGEERPGLGLSVSHGIVRQHGGWMQVDSAPGNGSRIDVYLPEENQG